MLPDQQFRPFHPYRIKVLWFDEAPVYPIIFFPLEDNKSNNSYYYVSGTGIVIAQPCINEVKQLFLEKTDRELKQQGVIPDCPAGITTRLRKFLTTVEVQNISASLPKQPNLASTSIQKITNEQVGGKHIMLVDDDPKIRELVARTFVMEGFQVSAFQTAEDALRAIERKGFPHLIVVDIHMPGMGGIELCRKLHAISDLPIILLTAHDDEETVIQMIEQYAEDYLVKPISLKQIVVRVNRVLRRMEDFSHTMLSSIQVDQRLTIDFYQRQAVVEGIEVPLTPYETRLLYILMRNAGQIVTKDFLTRRLWKNEESKTPLPIFVYRLRKKIEPDPKNPIYILATRDVGYSFHTPS